MKNFVYLLLTCCMLSCSLGTLGQTLRITKISPAQAKTVLPQSANALSSVLLGYCDDQFVNGVGKDGIDEMQAAIYITRKQALLYKNNQITNIHIGLFNDATNLSVFITEELENERLMEQNIGDLKEGWHKITLEKPYTINGNSFYIGYKCTGDHPAALSGKHSENGAWFGVEANGRWYWTNYAVQSDWNSLCIRAEVEGENMPNDLALVGLNRCSAKKGEAFMLEGIVENMSTMPVTSYEISYTINNSDAIFHTIETTMEANEQNTFRIEVPAINDAGKFPLKVSVTKVNGVEDTYTANNMLEDLVYCKAEIFERKVVVEEATGTWCMWCPRGIVGMREMKKKYPDTFIGIAVHGGQDKMAIREYITFFSEYFDNYFPMCIVNRKAKEYVFDPYFDNIEQAYWAERELAADAEITVKASYTSADSATVHITTESQFGYPEENTDYRIAFIVLENGVTGYKQSNAYSGGNSGEMGGFENLPSSVPIEFDDVARAVYEEYTGIKNSIPATIIEGEIYTYSYEFEMPSNIQNKKNTELVALLIDAKTKEIMNADKVEITGDPSEIKQMQILPEVRVYASGNRVAVDGEYDKLQVYTVDGVEISNTGLHSGIYIVRVTVGNHVIVHKIVL